MISWEIVRGIGRFLIDTLQPVDAAKIEHECNPSKRRYPQNRHRKPNMNSIPALTKEVSFRGSTRPESQCFFVGDFNLPEIFRRSEIGPMQVPLPEVVITTADHRQEGVIRLYNAVKLTGNDTHDSRFRGHSPQGFRSPLQRFVSLVAVAEVAHHAREPLQGFIFILDGTGHDIGPESRSILSFVPGFGADVAFAGGARQFVAHLDAKNIYVGKQERQWSAESLGARIAIDSLRPCVPGDDRLVGIQKKQRAVSQPGRKWVKGPLIDCCGLGVRCPGAFLAQHEQMA